eukprot:COSAG05_NODE_3863_length_1801_cov_2.178613_3_plen_154_part_00
MTLLSQLTILPMLLVRDGRRVRRCVAAWRACTQATVAAALQAQQHCIQVRTRRLTMRAESIGHFQPCMTEIYLHIDARMADYIRTHPYLVRIRSQTRRHGSFGLCWIALADRGGFTELAQIGPFQSDRSFSIQRPFSRFDCKFTYSFMHASEF